MTATRPAPSDREAAPGLFASIASRYSWMGAVLSLGGDVRWRRFLVSRIAPPAGSTVLDVAAGTGLVSRALAARPGVRVVALDVSEPMLRAGIPPGASIAPVLGRAERLPFPDGAFDALTFTYLFRYVDDPAATMRELARVVRPGGTIASLEFHVPEAPPLRAGWFAYTRAVLPALGALGGPAWRRTARFLGPSVERFAGRAPLPEQVRWWQEAGVREVRSRELSLGAAVVLWGRKEDRSDG